MAKINLYLSYAVSSNTATNIDVGETYTTTITPLDGYIFNTHDIIAIMDGGTVTVNKSTSEVSISATVTGEITIVVNALYCYARFDASFFGSGTHLISTRSYSVDAVQSTLSNEISAVVESLEAPTNVSLSNSTLTWTAVTGAVSYNLYANNNKIAEGVMGVTEATNISIDLFDYITTAGTFEISVTAVNATGSIESAKSSTVTFVTQSITYNLTNCTSDNNKTLVIKGTQYISVLTPNEGYEFGNDVVVSMTPPSTINFNKKKYRAVADIESVTGNIVITATAVTITKETLATPILSLSDGRLTIDTNDTEEKASSYVVTSGEDTISTIHMIQSEYYGVNTSMPTAGSTTTAVNTAVDGSSYSVTFTAKSGYTLVGSRVIITMSDNDITSTAWDESTGKVTIPSVTAPVDILVIGKVV